MGRCLTEEGSGKDGEQQCMRNFRDWLTSKNEKRNDDEFFSALLLETQQVHRPRRQGTTHSVFPKRSMRV